MSSIAFDEHFVNNWSLFAFKTHQPLFIWNQEWSLQVPPIVVLIQVFLSFPSYYFISLCPSLLIWAMWKQSTRTTTLPLIRKNVSICALLYAARALAWARGCKDAMSGYFFLIKCSAGECSNSTHSLSDQHSSPASASAPRDPSAFCFTSSPEFKLRSATGLVLVLHPAKDTQKGRWLVGDNSPPI